jgi:hypothetical protein
MAYSSTFWGWLITGGGALAAIGGLLTAVGIFSAAVGNFNFSAARDREKAEAASTKALAILKIECGNNLDHIKQLRQALPNAIPFEHLEMTAWDVVSSGGLLAQVERDTLGKLAEIYYLIGFANEQQKELLEATVGIASSLSNSVQMRAERAQFLLHRLDTLEPKLKDICSQMK